MIPGAQKVDPEREGLKVELAKSERNIEAQTLSIGRSAARLLRRLDELSFTDLERIGSDLSKKGK